MSNFKITGIRTVVIMSQNVEVATSFYRDILKLKEDYSADGMVSLKIGTDERQTFLLLHPTDAPEPVKNGLTIELALDNVDSAISAVRDSSGSVIQEPIDREWGVREAVIEDPDGYRIWLVQSLS